MGFDLAPIKKTNINLLAFFSRKPLKGDRGTNGESMHEEEKGDGSGW